MKNYIFAETEDKELEILCGIYNYYIKNTTNLLHVDEISINEFRMIIGDNKSRYKSFTIYDQDNICGFCYFSQYKNRKGYDRTAEISIYLKSEYIGKGIGKIAIKYLENIAKANGIKVLIATITEENINSIKLISNLGYDKCSHLREVAEKFGRVFDVLVFQKIL
jgi:phosphinothricin acetyltransferase